MKVPVARRRQFVVGYLAKEPSRDYDKAIDYEKGGSYSIPG